MSEQILPAVFYSMGHFFQWLSSQNYDKNRFVPARTHTAEETPRLMVLYHCIWISIRRNKSLRIPMHARGIVLTFESQIATEEEIPGAGNSH